MRNNNLLWIKPKCNHICLILLLIELPLLLSVVFLYHAIHRISPSFPLVAQFIMFANIPYGVLGSIPQIQISINTITVVNLSIVQLN